MQGKEEDRQRQDKGGRPTRVMEGTGKGAREWDRQQRRGQRREGDGRSARER